MWISRKRFEKLEKSLEKAESEILELKGRTENILIPFDDPNDEYTLLGLYPSMQHYKVEGREYGQFELLQKIVAHLGFTHVKEKKTAGFMKIAEKKKEKKERKK